MVSHSFQYYPGFEIYVKHRLECTLECSGLVIKSLERESSKESNHVSHLQKEILNMSKMMIEERVCEQHMLKARSMNETERPGSR